MIPARRELKYLVEAARLPALRRGLAGFCRLDPHSAAAQGHRYPVRSLYLDGPTLPSWRAKIDRAPRRLKLRVRSYGEHGSVFIEVKRREGEVIRKTRFPLEGDWATQVRRPLPDAAPAVHDFSAVLERLHAEPKLLVCYHREAWASEIDDYARVTFDTRLGYAVQETWSLAAEGDMVPLDDPYSSDERRSLVVVELKFAGAAPGWMAALVRAHELKRRGFSKYCNGVDQVWGRTRPGRAREAVFGTPPRG